VVEKIWLFEVQRAKLEFWKVYGCKCKYRKFGGLWCKKIRLEIKFGENPVIQM
jgi:hypothetical protein